LDDPERWATEFDDSTQATLRLVDAICGDSHALDPQLVREMQTFFDETELAEIILVAGQANLNNRAGNAAKQLLGP